jgi:hypothetical protein
MCRPRGRSGPALPATSCVGSDYAQAPVRFDGCAGRRTPPKGLGRSFRRLCWKTHPSEIPEAVAPDSVIEPTRSVHLRFLGCGMPPLGFHLWIFALPI